MDEAVRSVGKAAAVKITIENSYILAFHVDSRWHRYNVYATLRVTTSLSEYISAGMVHRSPSWTIRSDVIQGAAPPLRYGLR